MCTLSLAELRQMAAFMHEVSLDKASSDSTYANLYRNALANGVATVTDIGGQVFRSDIVPDAAIEEALEDEADAADRADRERDRIRQTRVGWPKQAMLLPPNTRRLTTDEMFDTIVDAFTDKGKAFNLIMEHLYAAQSQVPFARMPPNAVNIPSPLKALAPEVIAGLGQWNINVPVAADQDPAAYVPGELADLPDDNTMLMAPRLTVNIRPQPAAPQPPSWFGINEGRIHKVFPIIIAQCCWFPIYDTV